MPDVAYPEWAAEPDRMEDDLRRLLDHWRDLAGHDGVPDAANLDLVTLPFPLADILILSAENSPFSFRFDYTGSRWLMRFRREVTGRPLDEVACDPVGRCLSEALAHALGATTPTCHRHALDGRRCAGPLLVLPFSRAERSIDTYLVATIPWGSA